MHKLGCRHGFVVRGMDGMDEITIIMETLLAEVTPEGVKLSTIRPEEFGISRCSMDELRGGNATINADIVRSVLKGEKGPKRDIVLLNAAYALLAATGAVTVQEGMTLAAEVIDNGKALAQLEQLKQITNRYEDTAGSSQ